MNEISSEFEELVSAFAEGRVRYSCGQVIVGIVLNDIGDGMARGEEGREAMGCDSKEGVCSAVTNDIN